LIFKDFYLVHTEQPNPSAEWISYTVVTTGYAGGIQNKKLDVGERNEVLRISIDEYVKKVREFSFMYRQRFAEDYLIMDKEVEFKRILKNRLSTPFPYSH